MTALACLGSRDGQPSLVPALQDMTLQPPACGTHLSGAGGDPVSALQAPSLERVTFLTSRLLDFCSRKELIAQTGHSDERWPPVVQKELEKEENASSSSVSPCGSVSISVILEDRATGLVRRLLTGRRGRRGLGACLRGAVGREDRYAPHRGRCLSARGRASAGSRAGGRLRSADVHPAAALRRRHAMIHPARPRRIQMVATAADGKRRAREDP